MHTILHIGAGQANELPQFLKTGAEQITLVEPNPELAEQLRQRTAQHPQVTVVEAAITTSTANNQLQEYNLPEACSLHPATGLKTLFPGLKVNTTHTVTTLSPDQLLKEHGPQSGQRALLTIEVPGEEHALLQTLMNTDQLKEFCELRVNANPTPYFQGSVPAEKTLRALVDYGYEITDDTQQDPDWPSWQLARDPLRDQISILQAENDELKKSSKQLEELLNQNEKLKVQAEKQNDQLKQQLDQESDILSELTKELDSANKKLAAQQTTNRKLDDLEKKIATVGSNLTNHLDKKLINTAKQIENTIGLENYFHTGELPLNHYGWSINPDLALFLTKKIEAENYDLVIEFGSGNSTILFAKVLMKKISKQQQEVLRNKDFTSPDATKSSQESLERCALLNDTDPHKRVLSFEHNKDYYEQSTAMLRQAGLEKMVNLVHAPLVDYSYLGEEYLYYDCDRALTKIAETYESKAPNILVLVDGPSGETGLNTRFPALPKLLNHFTTANVDLILDDYNRIKEKAIAENWLELLNKRAISYTEKKIPLVKGAICIAIEVSTNQK